LLLLNTSLPVRTMGRDQLLIVARHSPGSSCRPMKALLSKVTYSICYSAPLPLTVGLIEVFKQKQQFRSDAAGCFLPNIWLIASSRNCWHPCGTQYDASA
jgi:hypothetical protein